MRGCRAGAWSFAAVLAVGGCTSRLSVGLPADIRQTESVIGLGTQGKSDLLFMIDNSPSMEAMQTELRQRFGDLVDRLTNLNKGGTLDLHIGVVTSDYGAGDTAGGGCTASPGGDAGRLQAVGAAADSSCLPPLGAPFIEYQIDALGNVTTNLPAGQDLETTFTCMASVGAGGCGFEHQLESVYAALHDQTTNAGFVRDDASLAVLFLTNEDDGSAPPTAKFYESGADVSVYGAYDTFRQTRFAIECGGALLPYGDGAGAPQTGCLSAPAGVGLAYDVSRYIDFFTQPSANGGLKADPTEIALLAIAAPSMPVATELVVPTTGLGTGASPSYEPCGPQLSSTCVERLAHSCQNSVAPGFFGDPAVRLESVLDRASTHQIWSICGQDPTQPPSFAVAMQGVGDQMAAQAAGGCMPGPLVTPERPQCSVTLGDDQTALSRCPASGGTPCWGILSDPLCPARIDPETGFGDSYRLYIIGNTGRAVHAKCLTYSSGAAS